MDTYDIFKKLRKGAKTIRKKQNCVLVKNRDNNDETSLDIKEEPVDNETEFDLNKFTSPNEDNIGEHDLEEDEPKPTVTLLGSITSADKKKRKKKKQFDEKKKLLLAQEQVNLFRNQQNITVVGKRKPDPIRTFQELPIKDDIKKNLRLAGYIEPTPIQKQAMPAMLQNRQILACAPTGSGKTAAFLVPIIHSLKAHEKVGFRAVLLCPTRELAKQTQRECVRLSEGQGLRVHIINKIGKTVSQFGAKTSQKYDILVTTPNRLCFLLKQDPPAISLSSVEWLIIDEADKLFEDGVRSFREQLDQILEECSNKNRKIAMFSATYTPVVAKWCVRNMKDLLRITVGHRNAAAESVDQELLFVGHEQGKLLAFRDIIRKGVTPPVLVFVQSKERAQQLFTELVYDGINVDAIHADRTQLQRDNTVKSFREGRLWFLICTELMARGIDFKGVNLVINYDFPPSAISYVHRVGRAGRAGHKGRAITFFTVDDTVNLRSIAQIIKQSGCEVPDYMLAIKKKSKKEIKKLKSSAPPRDDILTFPKSEREKIAKIRNRKLLAKSRKEAEESNTKKKQKPSED